MNRTSSSVVMGLGPLARRLLARRRRWLRWAAIGLAVLTLLSAAAQILHRPAPRRMAVSSSVPVRPPAPRLVGVGDVVPQGMRAVNLIVPAAATFGGRLAPWSHVDVLAAFDIGQDRAVRRVVASGLILHVAQQTGISAAAPSPFSGNDGRLGAPTAEVALAVPAAHEREVVMAQAFGRVFLAVDPAKPVLSSSDVARAESAAIPAASTDTTLSLRRYLGLPPAAMASAAVPRSIAAQPGVPPLPFFAWPPDGRAARTSPLSERQVGHPRPDATVEVIEGTSRTVVEVSP